ncbi:TonB-dependent receptor [Novosphingobium flavum]|uniref:TonB-dependent receptor n=1 Tax=Novosphingobium flavum TaxID=1778672 RepID=A0A7X1KL31_9SPHN|nr:TonB-dependent receptor [Novosphingobium flavum]MBC2664815.1 TonB-dependent receptor [Novosphingobium flavum]
MSIKSIYLLGTASALVFAVQAHAQETAAPPPADVDIVVTGSRVVKNGDDSPSPVTVVSSKDLMTTMPGMSLAEGLNTIPAFSGSRQSTSNPTNTGTQSGGNGAANTLNLRNLGANRTLVLEDGRRVPPTLFNGLVDVDIVPQMLVDRVDIVTGGVSAVYGSDAVSGVVNYVLNRKFNGFKGQASAGISRYGDDGRRDVGFAYGTQLGERLHVEASYQYRKEDAVRFRSSRPTLQQVGVTGAGTATSPYVLQTNLRQSGTPFGGLITSGTLNGKTFTMDGVLSSFVNGTATGTSGIQIGGDGGYFDGSLISGSEAHQLFGRADYELSDSVHAFVQASGTFKTNVSDGDAGILSNVTLSRDNAFLPAAVKALIPATETTFTYSQLLNQVPPAHEDMKSSQFILTAGLDGSIGGWKWTADYTHGFTKLDNRLSNDINRQKLAAALDAVSSNGQIVCQPALTNAAYAGCVPFNPFGPTAASQGAISYITDTVNYIARTTTDNVAGSISGDVFEGWAGPLTAALSGEWRRIGFVSTSTSTPDNVADCTSLRFGNCKAATATVAATSLNDFQFGASPGGLSQTVWEGAGEFQMPLIKDAGIIQSLNLNAAARYTHYSTSGNYWTWKIGGDLELAGNLRFRVTRSRDIRAPTLYELFAPTSQTIVRATDYLTGTNPTIPQRTLGNPGLTAEIGNALTAGVVWKPARGLSLAVDAYRINISNAITQVTGSTQSLQTACYNSGGTSPYCALQVRPNGLADQTPANAATMWLIQNINLAQVKTWGVDFEVNYQGELFGRPFQTRVLAAWQPHIYYIQPDVPTIDQGGVAFGPLGLYAAPSVRLNANFRYQVTDSLTFDINERWRNAMKLGGDPTQVWVNNHIDAFGVTNLNLSWDIKRDHGGFQFYVNVQNLFDAKPPIGAYSGNGSRAGLRDGFAIGDDIRGRYYTAGVKVQF